MAMAGYLASQIANNKLKYADVVSKPKYANIRSEIDEQLIATGHPDLIEKNEEENK